MELIDSHWRTVSRLDPIGDKVREYDNYDNYADDFYDKKIVEDDNAKTDMYPDSNQPEFNIQLVFSTITQFTNPVWTYMNDLGFDGQDGLATELVYYVNDQITNISDPIDTSYILDAITHGQHTVNLEHYLTFAIVFALPNDIIDSIYKLSGKLSADSVTFAFKMLSLMINNPEMETEIISKVDDFVRIAILISSYNIKLNIGDYGNICLILTVISYLCKIRTVVPLDTVNDIIANCIDFTTQDHNNSILSACIKKTIPIPIFEVFIANGAVVSPSKYKIYNSLYDIYTYAVPIFTSIVNNNTIEYGKVLIKHGADMYWSGNYYEQYSYRVMKSPSILSTIVTIGFAYITNLVHLQYNFHIDNGIYIPMIKSNKKIMSVMRTIDRFFHDSYFNSNYIFSRIKRMEDLIDLDIYDEICDDPIKSAHLDEIKRLIILRKNLPTGRERFATFRRLKLLIRVYIPFNQ